MAGENRLVIYAALLGNTAIAVTKFFAAAITGSSAMLSEAIPAVQRVKDLTDHSTGENPYYS